MDGSSEDFLDTAELKSQDPDVSSSARPGTRSIDRQATKPRYRPNRSSIDENAANSDLLTAELLTKQLDEFDSPQNVCGYAAYVLSARLRFAYFFLLLMIIAFVALAALEFIIIFNVILPEAREEAGFATRAAVFLCMSPIVFVGGAMFIQTLAHLVADAYTNSLRVYRIHLVAFFHLLLNWKRITPVDRKMKYQENFPGVDRKTLVFCAFWVPVFLEAAPIIGMLTEAFRTGTAAGAVTGYFIYAVRTTGALAGVFLFFRAFAEFSAKYFVTVQYLTDISPYRQTKWDIPLVHSVDLDARVLNLARSLCTNKMCWQRQLELGDASCFACCKCCFTESLYAKYTRKVNWYIRLIVNLLAFVLVGLLASFGLLPIGVAYLGICLSLLGLGMLAQEKWPSLGGTVYTTVIVAFTVIGAALFVFAVSNLSLKGNYRIQPAPTNTGALPLNNGLLAGQFSLCKLQWDGLNALDLGILSNLAYATTNQEFITLTARAFSNTYMDNYTIVHQTRDAEAISFRHIRFHRTGLDVVTVRGTSTVTEVYLDLYLYFGIGLVQASSRVLPITGVVPDSLIKRVLYLLSVPGFAVEGPRRHLLTYVDDLVNNGGNVIVTGHSLGGALAGLAGARSKTPAMTFSPPGLFFVNEQLGISSEDLRIHVTIVVPDNDVVPLVDSQLGTVQYIKCDGDTNTCHSMSNTICMLRSRCGDPRGRDYSLVCDGEKKSDDTMAE